VQFGRGRSSSLSYLKNSAYTQFTQHVLKSAQVVLAVMAQKTSARSVESSVADFMQLKKLQRIQKNLLFTVRSSIRSLQHARQKQLNVQELLIKQHVKTDLLQRKVHEKKNEIKKLKWDRQISIDGQNHFSIHNSKSSNNINGSYGIGHDSALFTRQASFSHGGMALRVSTDEERVNGVQLESTKNADSFSTTTTPLSKINDVEKVDI